MISVPRSQKRPPREGIEAGVQFFERELRGGKWRSCGRLGLNGEGRGAGVGKNHGIHSLTGFRRGNVKQQTTTFLPPSGRPNRGSGDGVGWRGGEGKFECGWAKVRMPMTARRVGNNSTTLSISSFKRFWSALKDGTEIHILFIHI